MQNLTSSALRELFSMAALTRGSVTDEWMITLCCCAASKSRSSADLSLLTHWGVGGGVVRLVRKLATNEIHPLIDRFSLARSAADIAGPQSRDEGLADTSVQPGRINRDLHAGAPWDKDAV
jgi:hypothetical protein